MKRKTRGGSRAKPPQASTITAKCIISFAIAALIVVVLLLCTWHTDIAGGAKKTNSKSPKVAARSSAPASPLGGDGLQGACTFPSSAVTTLPLDEPLEGGGTAKSGMETETNSPAASRERPAIEAMQSEVVEAQQAREAQERADLVARINNFLGNSPLAGLGEYMVAEQERTTVSARLCCAVAREESQLGRICPPGNPFGMGPGMHFASWQAGITAWFDNCLKHPSWAPWQTGYDLQHPPYYCVLSDKVTPNPVYGPNITGLAESI